LFVLVLVKLAQPIPFTFQKLWTMY